MLRQIIKEKIYNALLDSYATERFISQNTDYSLKLECSLSSKHVTMAEIISKEFI